MIRRPVSTGMGSFTLVWLGQTISFVGSRTTSFAIGVSLLLETGSVTRYSWIALAVALPLILLSPLAGVLADRFERRHVLLSSTFASTLGSLALLRVVQAGGLEGWHVYALVAFKSATNAFAWPAFTAATTLIVGKRHLARASGLNSVRFSLGQVLGPLLGGLLLAPLGLELLILLDVATFLVALAFLLSVRFPQPAGAPERHAGGLEAPQRERVDPVLGWRFIRGRPGLLRLLWLAAGLQFSLGFAQTLFVPLVLSFSTPAALGTVLSLAAGGMAVGGLIVTVWGGPAPERRVATILGAMAVEGLLLTLAGLEPSAVLIASAAFFFMFGIPFIGSAQQAIWQSKVPPDLQGRAFAVRGLVQGGAAPVAIAAAGPLADYVFEPLLAARGPLASTAGELVGTGPGRGIGLLLVLLGFGLMAAVAVASRSRRLRRLEEETPDAEVGDSPDAGPDAGGTTRDRPEILPALPALPAAALLLVLAAATIAAISSQRPPDAVPSSATAEEFSAERAWRHVEALAHRPRPAGSPAHRQAREYLVAELRALGLETEVQETVAAGTRAGVARVARIANVAARLDAPSAEPGALLLAAHYDSVAGSPGAGDDAAAVATLLETARALTAGAPLRRDVILLFTDGEELGLLGARAFVAEHPWAREVAAAVNFEGRGHGGPVYMFETGGGNDWWIRQLVAGVERPAANSLMREIYELLPNATDFMVFRGAGWDGFNLAFIEGLSRYHTALDRAGDLDPRTVQHQGDYALGLARRLGSVTIPPGATRDGAPDRAYFQLPGITIHYPPAVAVAAAALAILLCLAVWRLGFLRRRLTPAGVLQGFLAFLALLFLVPAVITLAWALVRTLGGIVVLMGSTDAAYRYMIAFACLAVAAFAAAYRFFRGVAGPWNLAVGAQIWWAILAVLSTGPVVPATGNFLFVWPLVASAAGLGVLLRFPALARRPWLAAAVLGASALPAVLLLAPFIASVYVGLQTVFELGGGALALLVLLLGLLIPQLDALTARHPGRLPALATAAGGLWLAAALAVPGGPVAQNSVLYAYDADSGERHWFSLDPEVDPWTRGFGFEAGAVGPFRHFFPLVAGDLPRAAAPAADLPAPGIELLERRAEGPAVGFRLRLRAAGESQVRAIWVEPPGALLAAEIAGRRIPASTDPIRVLQQTPPAWPEEEISLRVRRAALPATVHVTEQLDGWPPGLAVEPRPPNVIPRPLFTTVRSDVTLVRRSLRLDRTGGPPP